MVLGRFLRSTPPPSPSSGPGHPPGAARSRKSSSAGSASGSERTTAAQARPSALDRCLGDVRDAQRRITGGGGLGGRASLFLDLEGTLLRTFSRDDLRSLPEDTHFAQSAQGEEILLRIRPYAMEFLLRMKRDAGLRVAVYTATCRASAAAKAEALERACPGFRFDFIIHQDTAGAWDDGTKRLRLVLGGAEAAREKAFLIDTKKTHVDGQEEDARLGAGPHEIVNAAAIDEFGPFMPDSAGNLADMRTIYGVMTAEELAPIYAVFRNFEVENSTFRAWLQKVCAAQGTSLRSLRPLTDGAEEDGEDWELVEAAPKIQPTEPLVIDDFFLVEGDTSCSSEGGMATPRQTISDDDDLDSSNRPSECMVSGASEPSPPEPPAAAAAPTSPVSPKSPSMPMPLPPAAAEPAEAEKGSTADGDAASDGSSTTTDDEPSFRCAACRGPIFKACEIISANYHAQTSPGYLLSAAHNVHISVETQTAVYTTGRYTIQEVSCLHCAAVLGVTYCGAADARNQYKVGKFLVGRDRLQLPPGVVHPMDKAKN